jgi:hypothetical protein
MYTNEKVFFCPHIIHSSIHPSIQPSIHPVWCKEVVGGVSLWGYNFGGGDQPYLLLLYTKEKQGFVKSK